MSADNYINFPLGIVMHDSVKRFAGTIGANTVIGKEGFGYERREDGTWREKDHPFSVVIGDNVDIGANTCIDRGSWRDTVIGDGCKIDNLVHIAHNVQLGKNVIVVAGAVICGSVTVGDGAWIGAGAIINQRIDIGTGAFIGSGAVVTKNVPPKRIFAGVPARDMGSVREDIY